MLELFKDFKIRSQKGIGILLVIPPPLYILSDYYETCYFLDIACPPPPKKNRAISEVSRTNLKINKFIQIHLKLTKSVGCI